MIDVLNRGRIAPDDARRQNFIFRLFLELEQRFQALVFFREIFFLLKLNLELLDLLFQSVVIALRRSKA